MSSAVRRPTPQRHRGAGALLRRLFSWLLVAVLALDLVSAPLHAHRHDGEWSVGGALAASIAHDDNSPAAGSVGIATDIEHDGPPGLSHATASLRSAAEPVADTPSADPPAPPSGGPASRVAWAPGTGEGAWPPEPHRAGPGTHQSLPPPGRAPPFHA